MAHREAALHLWRPLDCDIRDRRMSLWARADLARAVIGGSACYGFLIFWGMMDSTRTSSTAFGTSSRKMTLDAPGRYLALKILRMT
jgi:hypothetical protein